MNFELKQITFEDKSVLQNLMQLYQYDFSEFNQEIINRHGLFGYKYLDNYWTEEGRYPFFVLVEDELAGFVLIRQANGETEIAEFFIMRKFRGSNLGKDVARKIFERFPGNWQVAQEHDNKAAQIFWRKVVEQYTNGKYESKEDERFITLFFSNNAQKVL